MSSHRRPARSTAADVRGTAEYVERHQARLAALNARAQTGLDLTSVTESVAVLPDAGDELALF